MPPATSQALGYAIALMLAVLAIGFGLRQRIDRARRDPELSPEDHAYYSRQDVRRLRGSTTMILIACGMAAGLALDPRAGLAGFRVWGLVWIGVSVLVSFLLVLALLDWFAIRAYAGRHRRALLLERLEALRAERQRLIQRGGYPSNGVGEGPQP